jgi:hypothetical protein
MQLTHSFCFQGRRRGGTVAGRSLLALAFRPIARYPAISPSKEKGERALIPIPPCCTRERLATALIVAPRNPLGVYFLLLVVGRPGGESLFVVLARPPVSLLASQHPAVVVV